MYAVIYFSIAVTSNDKFKVAIDELQGSKWRSTAADCSKRHFARTQNKKILTRKRCIPINFTVKHETTSTTSTRYFQYLFLNAYISG